VSKLLVDEISDADNTGPVTVTDGLNVSSGNVLVGTTSNYAENVQAAFYGASNGGISLASGTSGLSRLMFADGVAGTAGAYVGSIIYSHADDSMRFNANGGTERMRILSTGGITFNGDTAAANALDDYEEGAFAPTFTSGSGTITTSTNVGRYVKIGNMVHCNFDIRSTGVSGISGAIGITGMPFTAHSPSRSAGSIWYMRDWGAALDNLRFGIPGNTSSLNFYTQAANGTVTSLDNGDFATGGDNNVLECSITYRTT
jgi:hypothetical protein